MWLKVDVAEGGLGSLVTWMGLEKTEREAAAENLPRERKEGGKEGGGKVGGREGRCKVERACWTGAKREWWPASDRRLAHLLCLHTAGGEGGKERPVSGDFQKPLYLPLFQG